jgi:hypothetical protein
LKDGWSWKEGKRLKGTDVCGLQNNITSKSIFTNLRKNNSSTILMNNNWYNIKYIVFFNGKLDTRKYVL